VTGAIDDAHAALADLLLDLVTRDIWKVHRSAAAEPNGSDCLLRVWYHELRIARQRPM
jgi:hypothetical protein